VKKKPEHYVDNAAFLASLREWRADCHAAREAGQPTPHIPDYVGECILKIAKHLSYKPNFVNYTFREDMISDGIENCLVYIHNFDPDKSSNPFGYFTQIIYYAFIRRIQKEKKHTYIRYKLMQQQMVEGGASTPGQDGRQTPVDGTMLNFDNVKDFINRFDTYTHKRRERRRETKGKGELPNQKGEVEDGG
jgi:DNA-directed RNA polymerase specialized sigma24 family protein